MYEIVKYTGKKRTIESEAKEFLNHNELIDRLSSFSYNEEPIFIFENFINEEDLITPEDYIEEAQYAQYYYPSTKDVITKYITQEKYFDLMTDEEVEQFTLEYLVNFNREKRIEIFLLSQCILTFYLHLSFELVKQFISDYTNSIADYLRVMKQTLRYDLFDQHFV